MKENAAMNGPKDIVFQTGGSTSGLKSGSKIRPENTEEPMSEKNDDKGEINEIVKNKEDIQGEIKNNLEKDIRENVQSEMNEQGEVNKEGEMNEQDGNKDEAKGEIDNVSENKIQKGMHDENKEYMSGEICKQNKKENVVDVLNGLEENKDKQSEMVQKDKNAKYAQGERNNQSEIDKENEGDINSQTDNTDEINVEIDKEGERKDTQSENNKRDRSIEEHHGEANKQTDINEGNQSNKIFSDINIKDEDKEPVKNKITQDEPNKHLQDENKEKVKGETNDFANSKIDIADFFKKYDEILLNSPVLSDTGEDEETDQGHNGEKGQGHPAKKGNMFQKLREDKTYRRKLLHTVFLCWSFVVLGWIIGQFGPSFLDLQVITHTRLEEGSAFMTSHSVGYLIGSLISGILFDKFNKLVLLFSAIAGNGITVVVIPWCVLYEMMIAIHTIKGLFSGGLDALGNAYLVYVWGDENGSYMQALHFAFALGGIISPLATAPFLVPRHHDDIPSTVAMTTPSTQWNSTIQNNTVLWTTILGLNNMTNSSTVSNEEPEFFKIESRVYIAYLISAFLAFTAAFPFLYMHLKSENKNGINSKQEEKSDTDDRKLPLRQKVLIMINMMCMMGIYSAIEDTYAGFLTTFVVQQLNWTKTLGSFATSFYWAAFGTGRFFGIFLVKFCYPVRMISIYCMLLVLAFVGLLFSSTAYFDEGLWVCVPLAGLALSIIFPTVFTWTEEELLPVTGKVASLFLIASSSGTMINPIVLGFLMDELTPMYFCYLLLGESIILFLLYVSALCLSRNIQKGKLISEGHLDIELPVKSSSEPELYKGEDEGLLSR